MKNHNSDNVHVPSQFKLLIAITFLILNLITPLTASAGWAWPWNAGKLEAEAAAAHEAEIISQYHEGLAEQQADKAEIQARHLAEFTVFTILISGSVIVYLIKTRKIIQNIIKKEVVENVIRPQIIQNVIKKEVVENVIRPQVIQNVIKQEVIVRSPAHDIVPNKVVIDGTNVVYGAQTNTPSLLNLLALLIELQKQKCTFQCFFDANTQYILKDAGKETEAAAFLALCAQYPDQFIPVNGGKRADDYILDHAHTQGTPIISNDRYRDYEEKYSWLKSDSQRRVPFILLTGSMHIIQMGIKTLIPTSLKEADSILRSGLGEPKKSPLKNRPAKKTVHPEINSSLVLATA